MLDSEPSNPRFKLLLAVAIHSKWMMAGVKLMLNGPDTRKEDEDRIEALVTEALPHFRRDPAQAVMAGKLLHFLRRGYDELGRELCEDALAKSAEVSRSLAVIGQMRAVFGETDAALTCFDHAARLTRPGTDAHLYARFLECQALAAAGRWDDLAAAGEDLLSANRVTMVVVQPVFTSPLAPNLKAKAVVALMTRRRVQALFRYINYVSARLFRDPSQRENVLAPLSTLLAAQFGPEVFPEEVEAANDAAKSVRSNV